MVYEDGLWVRILGGLLGGLPWLAACAAGLVIVLTQRARLGKAAKPATAGFVVLLVAGLCGPVIGGYLQSEALRFQYSLTVSAHAMLIGAAALLKSLSDAAGLVLVAIAVVRGRGTAETQRLGLTPG
jgi:hypothetical protein